VSGSERQGGGVSERLVVELETPGAVLEVRNLVVR
jgi:hypothetical protein